MAEISPTRTGERAILTAPTRPWPALAAWAPYALLALVAALAYAWASYGRGLDIPDEGLLLHVADRLAAGQVPYRDVYFIYTPGAQYVLAALFRLFGANLGVEHALLAAVHVALVLVVYALAARLAWRPLAVAAALTVVASGVSPYRTLAGLLTILVLTRYAETSRRAWLVVTGLLIGASYLIGQEIGVYTLAATLGYLALTWLADSPPARALRRHLVAAPIATIPATPATADHAAPIGPRPEPSPPLLPTPQSLVPPTAADVPTLAQTLARAGLVLAAAAAVIIPWLVVIAAQGALPAMLDDTLRVTFTHQPRYMHVPLPPLLPLAPDDLAANVVWGSPPYLLYVKWMLYLPLATAAAAAGVLGARLLCQGADAPTRRALPLALFGALTLGTLAFRADYYHLRHILPVTLILLAWLLTLLRGSLLRNGWPRWSAIGVALPLVLILVVNVSEAISQRATLSVPLATARGTVLVDATTARDLGGLLRELTARTAPDEPIYVAPAETAIYFLADRPNPTLFGQLVPTETEVLREQDGARQRALIAALDAADVRWVVTANLHNVDGVPFAGYAPLIAAYLDDHFAPVAPYGYWTLQQRVSP